MNEMPEVEKDRLYSSIAISCCIWIVFSIVLIVLPSNPQETPDLEFPAVKITFSQPAETRTQPAETNAQPAAAKVQPAAAKDQPAAAKVQPAQPAQQNSQPTQPKAPPVTEKVTATKSASVGLGIPDFEKPISSSSRPAETLDFKSPQQSSEQKASVPVNEMEGSAAVVQKSSNVDVARSTESVSQTTSKSNGQASQSTLSKLDTISSVASQGETSQGSASDSKVANEKSLATNASSVSNLVFDLSSRKLLSPSDPSIVLPANLARLVDSDREVTVTITVTADGRVPSGLIVFTPSAVLPQQIRDYLRGQFSSWRFESATQDGQARFLYSIKIK